MSSGLSAEIRSRRTTFALVFVTVRVRVDAAPAVVTPKSRDDGRISIAAAPEIGSSGRAPADGRRVLCGLDGETASVEQTASRATVAATRIDLFEMAAPNPAVQS